MSFKTHGVNVFARHVAIDERGCFHSLRLKEELPSQKALEVNVSYSRANILRGMHTQIKRPQGKALCVLQGQILDVWVDVRPESPTFGMVESTLLDDLGNGIYLPPGLLHGFYAMKDSMVAYCVTHNSYDPFDQGGARWDSDLIKGHWPKFTKPVLSVKDDALPSRGDYLKTLK